MEITSAILTSDDINLVSDTPFTRLVLSYGIKLSPEYELTGLNNTTYTITKEDLGLSTLNNIYFKLKIIDALDNIAETGLYDIDILNDKEALYYTANNFKQDLDNLNYYDGVLEKLNGINAFDSANDVFQNYKNFLEIKLYANNFLNSIGR
jgi:hypothetical protein